MRNLLKSPRFYPFFSFITAVLIASMLMDPVAFASQAPEVKVFPSTIRIPNSLGTVEESWNGASNKTMIYIQDAHDSLEAQENIARLIHRAVAKYGVKTVYEEGYEGPVPTDSFFGFIENPKLRRMVSYFFLDKLRIGGAEYAHINRKQPFNLIGADNIKLHLHSIEQYREAAKSRAEIQSDLGEITQTLSVLINQTFPKELKEWIKLKERYESNQLPLLDYLKRSMELAESTAVSFPHALGGNPKLDPRQKISGMTEKDGLFPFISLLLAAEKTKNKLFIEQVKAQDIRALYDEIQSLENAIGGQFISSAVDRKAFDYYKTVLLLKRLGEIEITCAEFEAIRASLKTFSTNDFALFMAKEMHKPVLLSKRWEHYIRRAIKFYEIAEARNSAVAKSLGEFSKQPDEKIAVLVYGGFHKKNIRELLKQKNISYVIVSPRISSLSSRHQAYYKQLMTAGRLDFEIPFAAHAAARPQPLVSMGNIGRLEIRSGYAAVLNLRGPSHDWLAQVEKNIRPVTKNAQKARAEVRTENIEPDNEESDVYHLHKTLAYIPKEDLPRVFQPNYMKAAKKRMEDFIKNPLPVDLIRALGSPGGLDWGEDLNWETFSALFYKLNLGITAVHNRFWFNSVLLSLGYPEKSVRNKKDLIQIIVINALRTALWKKAGLDLREEAGKELAALLTNGPTEFPIKTKQAEPDLEERNEILERIAARPELKKKFAKLMRRMVENYWDYTRFIKNYPEEIDMKVPETLFFPELIFWDKELVAAGIFTKEEFEQLQRKYHEAKTLEIFEKIAPGYLTFIVSSNRHYREFDVLPKHLLEAASRETWKVIFDILSYSDLKVSESIWDDAYELYDKNQRRIAAKKEFLKRINDIADKVAEYKNPVHALKHIDEAKVQLWNKHAISFWGSENPDLVSAFEEAQSKVLSYIEDSLIRDVQALDPKLVLRSENDLMSMSIAQLNDLKTKMESERTNLEKKYGESLRGPALGQFLLMRTKIFYAVDRELARRAELERNQLLARAQTLEENLRFSNRYKTAKEFNALERDYFQRHFPGYTNLDDLGSIIVRIRTRLAAMDRYDDKGIVWTEGEAEVKVPDRLYQEKVRQFIGFFVDIPAGEDIRILVQGKNGSKKLFLGQFNGVYFSPDHRLFVRFTNGISMVWPISSIVSIEKGTQSDYMLYSSAINISGMANNIPLTEEGKRIVKGAGGMMRYLILPSKQTTERYGYWFQMPAEDQETLRELGFILAAESSAWKSLSPSERESAENINPGGLMSLSQVLINLSEKNSPRSLPLSWAPIIRKAFIHEDFQFRYAIDWMSPDYANYPQKIYQLDKSLISPPAEFMRFLSPKDRDAFLDMPITSLNISYPLEKELYEYFHVVTLRDLYSIDKEMFDDSKFLFGAKLALFNAAVLEFHTKLEAYAAAMKLKGGALGKKKKDKKKKDNAAPTKEKMDAKILNMDLSRPIRVQLMMNGIKDASDISRLNLEDLEQIGLGHTFARQEIEAAMAKLNRKFNPSQKREVDQAARVKKEPVSPAVPENRLSLKTINEQGAALSKLSIEQLFKKYLEAPSESGRKLIAETILARQKQARLAYYKNLQNHLLFFMERIAGIRFKPFEFSPEALDALFEPILYNALLTRMDMEPAYLKWMLYYRNFIRKEYSALLAQEIGLAPSFLNHLIEELESIFRARSEQLSSGLMADPKLIWRHLQIRAGASKIRETLLMLRNSLRAHSVSSAKSLDNYKKLTRREKMADFVSRLSEVLPAVEVLALKMVSGSYGISMSYAEAGNILGINSQKLKAIVDEELRKHFRSKKPQQLLQDYFAGSEIDIDIRPASKKEAGSEKGEAPKVADPGVQDLWEMRKGAELTEESIDKLEAAISKMLGTTVNRIIFSRVLRGHSYEEIRKEMVNKVVFDREFKKIAAWLDRTLNREAYIEYGASPNAIYRYLRETVQADDRLLILDRQEFLNLYKASGGDQELISEILLQLYPELSPRVARRSLAVKFTEWESQGNKSLKGRAPPAVSLDEVGKAIADITGLLENASPLHRERLAHRLFRELYYAKIRELWKDGSPEAIKVLKDYLLKVLPPQNRLLQDSFNYVQLFYQSAASFKPNLFREVTPDGTRQPLRLDQILSAWEQKQFLENEPHGVLNAGQARTGKTIASTLALLNVQDASGNYLVQKILYTTSKSALYEVEGELEQRLDPSVRIFVLDAPKSSEWKKVIDEAKAAAAKGQKVVLISSYHRTARFYEELKDFAPQGHIIDEVETLRGGYRNQKAPRIFGIPADYRVAISARFVVNRLSELATTLSWVYGKLQNETSKESFFREQSVYKALKDDDIYRLLDPVAVRWRRKTVLPELPKPEEHKIMVPYSKLQEKTIQAMRRGFVDWQKANKKSSLNEYAPNLFNRVRAERFVGMDLRLVLPEAELKDKPLDQTAPKIPALEKIIDQERKQSGKVLILSDIVEGSHEVIAEHLNQRYGKGSAVIVSSEDTLKNRAEKIRDFRSGPKPLFLIGSHELLGSSLNLFQVPGADFHIAAVVSMSDSWIPYDDGDRLVGPGQTHPVNVYRLISSSEKFESVEIRLSKLVKGKKGVLTTAADGKPELKRTAAKTFEEVLKQGIDLESEARSEIRKGVSIDDLAKKIRDQFHQERIRAAAGMLQSYFKQKKKEGWENIPDYDGGKSVLKELSSYRIDLDGEIVFALEVLSRALNEELKIHSFDPKLMEENFSLDSNLDYWQKAVILESRGEEAKYSHPIVGILLAGIILLFGIGAGYLLLSAGFSLPYLNLIWALPLIIYLSVYGHEWGHHFAHQMIDKMGRAQGIPKYRTSYIRMMSDDWRYGAYTVGIEAAPFALTPDEMAWTFSSGPSATLMIGLASLIPLAFMPGSLFVLILFGFNAAFNLMIWAYMYKLQTYFPINQYSDGAVVHRIRFVERLMRFLENIFGAARLLGGLDKAREIVNIVENKYDVGPFSTFDLQRNEAPFLRSGNRIFWVVPEMEWDNDRRNPPAIWPHVMYYGVSEGEEMVPYHVSGELVPMPNGENAFKYRFQKYALYELTNFPSEILGPEPVSSETRPASPPAGGRSASGPTEPKARGEARTSLEAETVKVFQNISREEFFRYSATPYQISEKERQVILGLIPKALLASQGFSEDKIVWETDKDLRHPSEAGDRLVLRVLKGTDHLSLQLYQNGRPNTDGTVSDKKVLAFMPFLAEKETLWISGGGSLEKFPAANNKYSEYQSPKFAYWVKEIVIPFYKAFGFKRLMMVRGPTHESDLRKLGFHYALGEQEHWYHGEPPVKRSEVRGGARGFKSVFNITLSPQENFTLMTVAGRQYRVYDSKIERQDEKLQWVTYLPGSDAFIFWSAFTRLIEKAIGTDRGNIKIAVQYTHHGASVSVDNQDFSIDYDGEQAWQGPGPRRFLDMDIISFAYLPAVWNEDLQAQAVTGFRTYVYDLSDPQYSMKILRRLYYAHLNEFPTIEINDVKDADHGKMEIQMGDQTVKIENYDQLIQILTENGFKAKRTDVTILEVKLQDRSVTLDFRDDSPIDGVSAKLRNLQRSEMRGAENKTGDIGNHSTASEVRNRLWQIQSERLENFSVSVAQDWDKEQHQIESMIGFPPILIPFVLAAVLIGFIVLLPLYALISVLVSIFRWLTGYRGEDEFLDDEEEQKLYDIIFSWWIPEVSSAVLSGEQVRRIKELLPNYEEQRNFFLENWKDFLQKENLNVTAPEFDKASKSAADLLISAAARLEVQGFDKSRVRQVLSFEDPQLDVAYQMFFNVRDSSGHGKPDNRGTSQGEPDVRRSEVRTPGIESYFDSLSSADKRKVASELFLEVRMLLLDLGKMPARLNYKFNWWHVAVTAQVFWGELFNKFYKDPDESISSIVRFGLRKDGPVGMAYRGAYHGMLELDYEESLPFEILPVFWNFWMTHTPETEADVVEALKRFLKNYHPIPVKVVKADGKLIVTLGNSAPIFAENALELVQILKGMNEYKMFAPFITSQFNKNDDEKTMAEKISIAVRPAYSEMRTGAGEDIQAWKDKILLQGFLNKISSMFYYRSDRMIKYADLKDLPASGYKKIETKTSHILIPEDPSDVSGEFYKTWAKGQSLSEWGQYLRSERWGADVLRNDRLFNEFEILANTGASKLAEQGLIPKVLSFGLDTVRADGGKKEPALRFYLKLKGLPGAVSLHEAAKTLPLKEKADVLIKTAEILEKLHEKRVLFNDMKPGNILVKKDPATGEIKVMLIDFGLSLELPHHSDFIDVETEEERELSGIFANPGDFIYGTKDFAPRGTIRSRGTDIYSFIQTILAVVTPEERAPWGKEFIELIRPTVYIRYGRVLEHEDEMPKLSAVIQTLNKIRSEARQVDAQTFEKMKEKVLNPSEKIVEEEWARLQKDFAVYQLAMIGSALQIKMTTESGEITPGKKIFEERKNRITEAIRTRNLNRSEVRAAASENLAFAEAVRNIDWAKPEGYQVLHAIRDAFIYFSGKGLPSFMQNMKALDVSGELETAAKIRMQRDWKKWADQMEARLGDAQDIEVHGGELPSDPIEAGAIEAREQMEIMNPAILQEVAEMKDDETLKRYLQNLMEDLDADHLNNEWFVKLLRDELMKRRKIVDFKMNQLQTASEYREFVFNEMQKAAALIKDETDFLAIDDANRILIDLVERGYADIVTGFIQRQSKGIEGLIGQNEIENIQRSAGRSELRSAPNAANLKLDELAQAVIREGVRTREEIGPLTDDELISQFFDSFKRIPSQDQDDLFLALREGYGQANLNQQPYLRDPKKRLLAMSAQKMSLFIKTSGTRPPRWVLSRRTLLQAGTAAAVGFASGGAGVSAAPAAVQAVSNHAAQNALEIVKMMMPKILSSLDAEVMHMAVNFAQSADPNAYYLYGSIDTNPSKKGIYSYFMALTKNRMTGQIPEWARQNAEELAKILNEYLPLSRIENWESESWWFEFQRTISSHPAVQKYLESRSGPMKRALEWLIKLPEDIAEALSRDLWEKGAEGKNFEKIKREITRELKEINRNLLRIEWMDRKLWRAEGYYGPVSKKIRDLQREALTFEQTKTRLQKSLKTLNLWEEAVSSEKFTILPSFTSVEARSEARADEDEEETEPALPGVRAQKNYQKYLAVENYLSKLRDQLKPVEVAYFEIIVNMARVMANYLDGKPHHGNQLLPKSDKDFLVGLSLGEDSENWTDSEVTRNILINILKNLPADGSLVLFHPLINDFFLDLEQLMNLYSGKEFKFRKKLHKAIDKLLAAAQTSFMQNAAFTPVERKKSSRKKTEMSETPAPPGQEVQENGEESRSEIRSPKNAQAVLPKEFPDVRIYPHELDSVNAFELAGKAADLVPELDDVSWFEVVRPDFSNPLFLVFFFLELALIAPLIWIFPGLAVEGFLTAFVPKHWIPKKISRYFEIQHIESLRHKLLESFEDDETTRTAKREMIYSLWSYLSDGNPIVRERAFGALLWAANRGMKSVDLAMREYWDALSFDAFDRNNPSSRSELRSHQFMEIVKDQTVNLESVLGEPGKQIELAYYGKIPVRSMQRKATGKFAAVIGLQGLKDYKILVNDGDKGIFDWGELYRTAVLEAEELKRDGEVVHPVFEGTDIVTLVNPNWRMEIEFQKAAGDHLEFEVYLMQRSEVRSKWEKRLHVLTSGTQRERIETTLNSLVKIRAKALEDHKSEIAGQALRHYEELQGLAGLTSEMMNFRLREVEEAISFVRQTARILDITDPKRAWAAVQTTVWAGLFSEGLVKRHDDPERQGEWVNVRDRAEVIFQQFRAAKKAEAKVPAPEVIASAEKLNDDFMKLFNQLRRSEARVAEERVMAKQVAQFAQAGIYDQADREPFPGASKGAFIEIPISRNGSMTFGSWRENKAADNRGKLKSLQIKVALKFKSKDGTVFLRPGMKGRISAHFRPVSEEDKKSRWLLELEFPEEPRFPKRVYFFKDGGLQMPPPEAVPVVNRELTDSEAAAVKSKQVLTQTILNAPKIRSLYDFYAWYRSMSDEELPSLMFQGKKMSMVTALSYLRKAKKLEHIYQISRDANADFYLEKHPEIRDLDISFNSSQVLDYWRWFYEKGGEKYFPSKRKKSPYLSASNAARVLVQAGKTSGNIKAFLTYVNEIRSAEVYKDIFVAEFERIFNGRTIPESQREVKDILYKEFRLDIAGRRYHRISIRAPIRFAYELYGRDLIEGLRARSESRVISEESRSEARSLKPISDHELVISYADMLAHIKQRAQTRELIKKSPRGKFLKPEDPKELRSELERKFPEAVLVQDWINRQILFLSPAFREDNFQVSLDFPNTPSSEVYPGQGALTFLRAEILERKKAAETYDFLFRVQNGKILMDIRKRDGQAYKRLHENQISMFISRFIESSAEPNFRELLKGISAASIYTGRSELRSPAGYRWAGDYTSAVRRVIRALEQIDHGNAEEKQKALHYLLDWQRKNGNRVVVYNRIYAPVPIILGHLKDPDFYPDKLEAIAKFMTQLPARELRRVITLLVIFSAKTDPETYSAGKTSSQIRFELLLELGQQAYLAKDGNAFKVMIGMLHQIRKDEAYSKDEREKAAEALQAIPDPKEIESHLSPRSEMRKAAAYGENKRVLIDFKDLAANFSDEQIKEAAFMAKRSQGRDFQVLIYNLDPTDKLGKFFRSLRISNLKTDINDLNSASKRIQGFKGEVIHLSSQNFALQREKLAGALAKAGIQESSIYSFRYQDAQSGTLGVAMKDLENGLLKKQLPDHFSYDAHGNIILLDASLAASWQRLYDSSLVFARAA